MSKISFYEQLNKDINRIFENGIKDKEDKIDMYEIGDKAAIDEQEQK